MGGKGTYAAGKNVPYTYKYEKYKKYFKGIQV